MKNKFLKDFIDSNNELRNGNYISAIRKLINLKLTGKFIQKSPIDFNLQFAISKMAKNDFNLSLNSFSEFRSEFCDLGILENISSIYESDVFLLDKAISSSDFLKLEKIKEIESLLNNPPKVSIVMPVYNREGCVLTAIGSILLQSYKNFEIIVCDDASTDKSVEIINAVYSKEVGSGIIKLLKLPKNKGVSKARNEALKLCTGRYISYLDSDNFWDIDHLLISVYFIVKYKVASLYTAVHMNDFDKCQEKIIFNKFSREKLLRGNYIDLNSYIHDRYLLEQYGGFDENLKRLVDWDLILRYSKDNSILGVPIVTVYYFLDNKLLKNISSTVRIDENADRIFWKNKGEYLSNKILKKDKLERLEKRFGSKDDKKIIFAVYERDYELAIEFSKGIFFEVRVLVLSNNLELIDKDTGEIFDLDFCGQSFIWSPDFSKSIPNINDVNNLLIKCFLASDFCYAFLNYDFSYAGTACMTSIRNQTFVRGEFFSDFIRGRRSLKTSNAILFNSPKNKINEKTRDVELSNVFNVSVVDSRKDVRNINLIPWKKNEKKRKVIFVFAMKTAVGGVERNTIEIIRQLNQDYDFVYIATEEINRNKGTLFEQICEVCSSLINLVEILTHKDYIPFLHELKKMYNPDLVWICNGSMWLAANSMEFRELFGNTPIIDQQVYDEKEGWIKRYNEPGIKEFDKFIAINNKIYSRFINDFKINVSKVDLIYSAIDGEKFLNFSSKKDDAYEFFDIPRDKKIFAFMGRLVNQKNPLDFLRLALGRVNKTNEFYILVGNGELRIQCLDFIGSNRMKNVKYIEYIDDTREFWQLVDGVIITSIYEGLPIAMLEAVGMGVPVFSTDVGDIKLIVDKFNLGLVIDSPIKHDVLFKSFDDFLKNLDYFQQNAKSNAIEIINMFSSKKISLDYKKCFDSAFLLKK